MEDDVKIKGTFRISDINSPEGKQQALLYLKATDMALCLDKIANDTRPKVQHLIDARAETKFMYDKQLDHSFCDKFGRCIVRSENFTEAWQQLEGKRPWNSKDPWEKEYWVDIDSMIEKVKSFGKYKEHEKEREVIDLYLKILELRGYIRLDGNKLKLEDPGYGDGIYFDSPDYTDATHTVIWDCIEHFHLDLEELVYQR